MYSRHIFIVFSVFALIACAVVILSVYSRSTPAQVVGLKAQMQQEIIQALQESVALREQALSFAQAKEHRGLITSLEVGEAQLKLSEARLQLAVAKHQPDVAIKEFHNIEAIRERQLQWIKSKVEAEVATDLDVAEARLQLLAQRVRLATTIRDMQ